MKLLDLFCGAGGAGRGYLEAIPPAYSRFIGGQVMQYLKSQQAIKDLAA